MNTQELQLTHPSVRVRATDSADMRALLKRHLDNCRARAGMHRLHCWAEAVHGVVAPRLVTTAVILGALALVVEQLV
jgi:hypothetical protein